MRQAGYAGTTKDLNLCRCWGTAGYSLCKRAFRAATRTYAGLRSLQLNSSISERFFLSRGLGEPEGIAAVNLETASALHSLPSQG